MLTKGAPAGLLQRLVTWWLENRLHIDVFATEVEDAVRMLSLLPGAGTPYAGPGIPGLRRLYLEGSTVTSTTPSMHTT